MTLVSVIMSAYNACTQIRKAVESIQRQTHEDWELILVEDASTDDSRDVISALAGDDERIRPIYNETNLGLAAGLNKAIVKAKGNWIARMDADDISLPDRLRMQLDYLKDHPDTDVLGAGVIEVNEQGAMLATVFRPERHEELVETIYKGNPFIHPTVIARKRFFEELGGYDPSLRRAQDYDLWLRGYRHFNYHNLQVPLLVYSRRSVPRYSDAIASARVLWSSADREHRWMTHGWYAARPLVAALLQQLGLARP